MTARRAMLAEARQIRIEQLHNRRLLAGLSPRCAGPSGEHNDSDTDITESNNLDYLDLPVTYSNSIVLEFACYCYSFVYSLYITVILTVQFPFAVF